MVKAIYLGATIYYVKMFDDRENHIRKHRLLVLNVDSAIHGLFCQERSCRNRRLLPPTKIVTTNIAHRENETLSKY